MDLWSVGLLVAVVASVGWSLYDLSRRFLTSRLSAWALLVWLTVPAVPLMLAWAAVEGEWSLGGAYWLPGIASVLLNVLANFAYLKAFQLSPLAVTLPLLSLTPVFTSLIGVVALEQAVSAREAAGIVAVVTGAALLTLSRAPAGGRGLRMEAGSLMMAVVALCWSVTPALDKVAMDHAAPALHGAILNGGVAVAGLAVLAARRRLSELGAIRGAGGYLAFAVAVGTVALGTQLVAIRTIPIGVVETLKRGIGAALAPLWGRGFFGEPVTTKILLAVALSVAGVALILL